VTDFSFAKFPVQWMAYLMAALFSWPYSP
jgi:hypothetical protein